MRVRRAEEGVEEIPEACIVVEVVGEEAERLVPFARSASPRSKLAQNAAQRLVLSGETPCAPVHRIDMRIRNSETRRTPHRRARPVGGRAAKAGLRQPVEHRPLDAVPRRGEDRRETASEQRREASAAFGKLFEHRIDRAVPAALHRRLSGAGMVRVGITMLQHGDVIAPAKRAGQPGNGASGDDGERDLYPVEIAQVEELRQRRGRSRRVVVAPPECGDPPRIGPKIELAGEIAEVECWR